MQKQPAEINYFFKDGYKEFGKTFLATFRRCGTVIADCWDSVCCHFGELGENALAVIKLDDLVSRKSNEQQVTPAVVSPQVKNTSENRFPIRQKLTPEEKYFYIYLMTNAIAGIIQTKSVIINLEKNSYVEKEPGS